jgi:hypothetical protein
MMDQPRRMPIWTRDTESIDESNRYGRSIPTCASIPTRARVPARLLSFEEGRRRVMAEA